MTILIKDNHTTGLSTLAHPDARPGKISDAITVKAIHSVPEVYPLPKLLDLWSQTCDLTWLNKPGDPMSIGRFEFDFAELGFGKIIR